jgi:hypoxanthine phosphoribosyltransferase
MSLNYTNELSKYYILSWSDFDNCIEQITNNYKTKNISAVYGEPRGGLPMAVALSHRLKVPLVHELDFAVQLKKNNSTVLWVDDIIDTEKTYVENKENFSYFASWVSRFKSNEFFSVTTSDKWVIFPWEVPEYAESDKDRYVLERREAGFLLNV